MGQNTALSTVSSFSSPLATLSTALSPPAPVPNGACAIPEYKHHHENQGVTRQSETLKPVTS